ncbi:MAG: hypothetical protein H6658_03375 [Ardenticatenaceae bacterium]|nr:hypothetical protein [Ardenticatenaceae bacterium]
MIDQGIERGIQQGIEQGIEQGLEQGRLKMVQEDILDLLVIHFEAVADELVEAIEAITDFPLLRQLHREAASSYLATFIEKLAA